MKSIQLYRSYWKNRIDLEVEIYICGWAEYREVIYSSDKFIDLVYDQYLLFDIDKFKDFVLQLNGNFSIIINSKDFIILCVDKMRCFPILYFQNNDNTFITDDIDVFRQMNNNERLLVNDKIIEQYLCSDFIFGPYTIFTNVYSLQAGEIVKICDGKHFRYQYFQWAPNMHFEAFRDFKIEASILDSIFFSIIKRMIDSAPYVNNWIIPLSGGHDSRMIINYLYKLGIKNVICYSFGTKNNIQSVISEKVATALGFEWHFIEYTPDTLLEISKSQEIEKYRRYAFNGSSVPHLQDFIAVYMLKKKEIIQLGDIFVPGHTLNFIAGDQIQSGMELCSSSKSALFYLKKHFNKFGYSKKNADFFKSILDIIETYKVAPNQIPEYFDWQEAHTKFITNWIKCYEYFGFDWRLPLWDNQLINYWSNIGYNYRFRRNLFFNLQNRFLLLDNLKSIPFANDIINQNKSLKVKIIEFIPSSIKMIIRFLGYSKSTYFVPDGLHLLYADNIDTIIDYQNSFSVPSIVRKYLSHYPKNMKLGCFSVNNVSSLLIIKEHFLYK